MFLRGSLLLGLACAACSSSPAPRSTVVVRQVDPGRQGSEERLVPGKQEWLNRVLKEPDREIDLVEAATVLACAKSGVVRPLSTIPRALDPYIRNIEKRLPTSPSPDQKIDALNEVLLPGLRREEKRSLRWLFETLGSERGGCVVFSLLYLIAADSVGVHVEPVHIPKHIFLRHSSPHRQRNIETTHDGRSLTESDYQTMCMTDPLDVEVLPEEKGALQKAFTILSRRQFVSFLACQTDVDSAENTKDYDLGAQIAPDFFYPLKMKGAYYTSKEEFQKGEPELSNAIILAPQIPWLFGLRALSRIGQKKAQAALEDIEVALKLCPNWPYYHFTKSMALGISHRYVEAIDACSRAIEKAPKAVEFWSSRAQYFRALKKYKEAIADYSKAIELDPNNADHYEQRANMWAMVGDEKQYEADRQRLRVLRNDH